MHKINADLAKLRSWRVSAPKGRLVFDEGEEPSAFYRVDTGCVRLQVHRGDGHRQILAFCLPGDFFGLQTSDARECAAEAAAASTLTRFPVSIISSGELDVGAVAGLIEAAFQMNSALADHLKGLSHGLAEERLLWFFDWMASRREAGGANALLELPMSRRDIADFLGLAQETLSRTFARLEDQGAISVRDARTLILRPEDRSARRSMRRPCGPDGHLAQLAG